MKSWEKLIYLLQKKNVSYLIPQVQPIIILLTIILGYFLFNEKLSNYQIFGSLLIILGVWFMNK